MEQLSLGLHGGRVGGVASFLEGAEALKLDVLCPRGTLGLLRASLWPGTGRSRRLPEPSHSCQLSRPRGRRRAPFLSGRARYLRQLGWAGDHHSERAAAPWRQLSLGSGNRWRGMEPPQAC